MNLSNMDDLLGFRIITPNIKIQKKITNELTKFFEEKYIKNYTELEKPSGYRGIHFISKIFQKNSLTLLKGYYPYEIQIYLLYLL